LLNSLKEFLVHKVLIFYRGFEPIIRGFKNLGCEVVIYNTFPSIGEIELADVALFDMYDIVKKPINSYLIRKKLNEVNCPVIVWNRDGPANKGEKKWRQFILRNFDLFNIYASHTLQPCGALRQNTKYLSNAASITDYFLERPLKSLLDPKNYQFDVGFVGNINTDKYPEMRRRANFLNALSEALDKLNITYIFSDSYKTADLQRGIIQSTKINLQYHAGCDTHFRVKDKYVHGWGLPERCYGIPACGGFLLSDERKHGTDDFGEDWCSFDDNVDDCVSKIRFYLDNFELTREIAERQHQRVMQSHTYEHRAKQLLAFANEWRAAR
jgi:spore maturation protein CgeB